MAEADFIERVAAVYRRVGEDIGKAGYHLAFVDVSAEREIICLGQGKDGQAQTVSAYADYFDQNTLEKSAPKAFAQLLRKANSGEVRFRGSSDAVEDNSGIRDKNTREAGVSVMIHDLISTDGKRWWAYGEWHNKPDKLEIFRYRLVKSNGKWRAE